MIRGPTGQVAGGPAGQSATGTTMGTRSITKIRYHRCREVVWTGGVIDIKFSVTLLSTLFTQTFGNILSLQASSLLLLLSTEYS